MGGHLSRGRQVIKLVNETVMPIKSAQLRNEVKSARDLKVRKIPKLLTDGLGFNARSKRWVDDTPRKSPYVYPYERDRSGVLTIRWRNNANTLSLYIEGPEISD
ncbi:hypothetical protein T265_10626 [Opisthorchis viverrini]|uniref:Uncharacterized protein n=1 Tax=Opisthorchis viverrini TaxID=6198 RepID=A0A075A0J2_OPIVI|nr:hypothetical protein T265_10626 [Opisthorchis viverrini]KER20939.1 hypothetical protein T265_10626 [Opisthorchis viverrini]